MSNKNNNKHVMEVIYSFDIGGSEMIAANLAKHFKKKGKSISVCATHSGKGPISDILEMESIACFAMDCESYSRIKRRIMLYKVFKKNKVDILHVHHVSMLALCYYSAKLAGVKKIVVTEHNEINISLYPKLIKKAIRLCNKINYVTVIHNELKKYFEDEIKVPSIKLKIIPNGVNTNKYFPHLNTVKLRSSIGVNVDEVVIGCIGRLHEYKDHKNLIRAVSIIKKISNVSIKLLIIGDGYLRGELETFVENENLHNIVQFLGERDDIDRLLNILDILVISSSTEGLPMVLLEAMSSGVPCIATSVGGIPNVITKNCGILVSPENPDQLANEIIYLAMNESMRKEMGRNARQLVLDKYTDQKMFKSYENILFD